MHTAKAEGLSEIFFNYSITDIETGKLIYNSSETDYSRDEDDFKSLEKLKEDGKCFYCYLDDYKASRALRNSLKYIKKMEVAQVDVLDMKYVKYGDDFEKIVAYNPNYKSMKLRYNIRLYNFTEVSEELRIF